MADKIIPPTDADFALAKKVVAWLESLEGSPEAVTSDYLSNLVVYSRAGLVTARGVGIVASAVVAYDRDLAKRQEREDLSKSVHVGKVGDKLHFEAKLLGVYTSQNDWGVSYIHKFLSAEGNVFTWFGSSRFVKFNPETKVDEDVPVGTTLWVKGTVKKHDEFKGVKGTVLTRASWTLSPDDEKASKAAAAKAKRDAAKATRAARKAFGEPKVVAEWVGHTGEIRELPEAERTSGVNFQRVEGPVWRVTQLAEAEFEVSRYEHDCRAHEGAWDVRATAETLEAALSRVKDLSWGAPGLQTI